ncbi:MAG TPA: cytochrome c oxidase subunit II [Candidatus Polarisedimenticolaceae bacterium]|nr:cytochrome c oxidase subunit II [Candidatus Polarisedimenticolaceae bacterium]
MKRVVVALALLAASACVAERGVLAPRGPAARRLADLGWPVLIGFTAVSIVMWGLIVWIAKRRTGSLGEHDPPEIGGGEKWILIGGLGIPVLAFAITFGATLRTLSAFPEPMHAHGHTGVRVVGHQWWWEVHTIGQDPSDHTVSANEIHIPVGPPVDVELVTADVIHSLWVPRLHGKVDLVPGLKNHIRLQADAPGVYPGRCAELCGVQHAHMRFLVIAQTKEEYDRWWQNELLPAHEPQSDAARRGKRLFETSACLVCHRIRGTAAYATLGPDLTHLATRQTIGAGSLPNDVATLHAWVADAPSLKPGTLMPPITSFSGEELHDLVAYLQELE